MREKKIDKNKGNSIFATTTFSLAGFFTYISINDMGVDELLISYFIFISTLILVVSIIFLTD